MAYSVKATLLTVSCLTLLAGVGCSKEVRRTGTEFQTVQPALLEPVGSIWSEESPVNQPSGTPVAQPAVDPVEVTYPVGTCADPIGAMNDPALSVADVTGQAWGFWDLVDFKTFAVATLNAQGSPLSGVSSVVGDDSGMETVCQNMDQLPRGKFLWSIAVPKSFSAVDGAIDEEILSKETVVGSESRTNPAQEVTDRNSVCKSLGSLACEPIQIFRTGPNQVSILKVTQNNDPQGNVLLVKTLAKYELWGEGRVIPRPSPRPMPSSVPPSKPATPTTPMQQAQSPVQSAGKLPVQKRK